MSGQPESTPRTIRYVTRGGFFAEIIATDPGLPAAAREHLAGLSPEEKRAAAARYVQARYGHWGTAGTGPYRNV